jgi:hypothetical protein
MTMGIQPRWRKDKVADVIREISAIATIEGPGPESWVVTTYIVQALIRYGYHSSILTCSLIARLVGSLSCLG